MLKVNNKLRITQMKQIFDSKFGGASSQWVQIPFGHSYKSATKLQNLDSKTSVESVKSVVK